MPYFGGPVGLVKIQTTSKCGLSLTNKNTKQKQTRENTQQLNISVQLFITTIRLKITYFKYIYLIRPFFCVVSLSIFTSCAVSWRARRASQNTNNE